MIQLPEILRKLLKDYYQRWERPELKDCAKLEEFGKLFPLQKELPAPNLPEEKSYSLFLSDVNGKLKVPWTETLLAENLKPFSFWLKSFRLEGKVLSLEPLGIKGFLDWGGIPIFFYLGKILQEFRDPFFQIDFQDEGQAFQSGLQNIGEVEAIIGDGARVLRFLRFLKGIMGREVRQLGIRFLFLTGYPEIPTIFAFQAKGILPKVEVREFYSSPLGIMGIQTGEKPGITLSETAFFEWRTKKGIKLASEATKGEYGKLIVSTRQVPRFVLPETFLFLGNGVFKNEGAEERYPLWRFWLFKT